MPQATFAGVSECPRPLLPESPSGAHAQACRRFPPWAPRAGGGAPRGRSASPPPALDLGRLGELLSHCGIRLDHRDRPVTSDTEGASRDPGDWRALATYGHPELQSELRRVSAGHDTDPLVIETVEERHDVTVSAARRSDRTPPDLVTTRDLGDLGTPVSTGEARAEAQARAEA